MKTLYLGLDPENFCRPHLTHYPVIRTVRLESPELKEALALWSSFTHVIFTSKTAVRFWREPLIGKTAICIGNATAKELPHPSLVAPESTQEGVIRLLETLRLGSAFIFLPRSRLSRPALTEYLRLKSIRFFPLDLYDTIFQKIEPIPDLNNFDEIVFTSPSTVRAFLQIYGKLPPNKKLTPIGPVTGQALNSLLVENFSSEIY